ncbi:DUF6082 family protein [Streptomyces sp. NBC_00827]|uniref:DUF6082 family protein n=1 Tax=Streptomyces sp. NBC_00827 TaxID=2903677 RepID=UPI00386B51CB|nr:DUF6082 family protein [Streptomyces sp. NBC_00827]
MARAWRSAISICAWTVTAVAGITAVGAASVALSGWLIQGVEAANGSRRTAAERSAMGDYFGGVSAVFSGLALLLLVVTLLFQQRELRLQRRELSLQREELAASRAELRRSAEADMRSLHVQLTQMAMADPSLAEVWNDFSAEPDSTLRQNLFANLTFGHFLLAYAWGNYSDDEILVHAQNLVRSPAFNRYWVASRPRKAALHPDSDEGRLFRIFEQAIAAVSSPQAPAPGPDT